jgi:hypothetical protein
MPTKIVCQIGRAVLPAALALGIGGRPALAQPVANALTYVTVDYGTYSTFLTGMRDDTITY